MILKFRSKDKSGEDLKAKIAELESTIKLLKTDLIHDALTGLKTRAFFDEEARVFFNTAMHKAASTRKEWFGFRNISFVFFDIDHFKSINDTYGHFAGDKVIKAVAKEIERGVRDGDIAARWGGEEIAVALVGENMNNARKKAESIRLNIEKMIFDIEELKVTVSAGVSCVAAGYTFEDVLKQADQALYKAKQTGRNKVVAFNELEADNL